MVLIDKKMRTAELRKAADIAPDTLTMTKRDQEVTMRVLERIQAGLEKHWNSLLMGDKKYYSLFRTRVLLFVVIRRAGMKKEENRPLQPRIDQLL